MDSQEKKVYLLLIAVIYHYHGLDNLEREHLEKTAVEIKGLKELDWVNDFIEKDYINAFERARKYLSESIGDYPEEKRKKYIKAVWEANKIKGFITEMEAIAMIRLAEDWKVREELARLVQGKVMNKN